MCAIVPMLGKVVGTIVPGAISADAACSLGMFNCLWLGSDAEILVLKCKVRFWDDRLGVTLQCGDMVFVFAKSKGGFGYLRLDVIGGGLLVFGRVAVRRFEEIGVILLMGCKVIGLQQE